MAESYPLTPPTGNIARVRLIANNVVGVSESPFTLSQQVYRHQGQGWAADISLTPMKRDTAEEWVAFLLRLRGNYGTFLLGDPNCQTPRGSAATDAGVPTVNGANQTGDELNIQGLPFNATGYLKAGDYIQLGEESTAKLYKVLENVDSDELGQATLNLWPAVRVAPNDDDPVTVSNCVGNFRLNTSETSWDISTVQIYGITFGAVEAL